MWIDIGEIYIIFSNKKRDGVSRKFQIKVSKVSDKLGLYLGGVDELVVVITEKCTSINKIYIL